MIGRESTDKARIKKKSVYSLLLFISEKEKDENYKDIKRLNLFRSFVGLQRIYPTKLNSSQYYFVYKVRNEAVAKELT